MDFAAIINENKEDDEDAEKEEEKKEEEVNGPGRRRGRGRGGGGGGGRGQSSEDDDKQNVSSLSCHHLIVIYLSLESSFSGIGLSESHLMWYNLSLWHYPLFRVILSIGSSNTSALFL